MTTDEQINRDIAEWCGIKPKEVSTSIPSDRVWTTELQYPNFLDEIQGLGLLFKYAINKIIENDDIPINLMALLDDWVVDVVERKYESPTRALAIAIHRLIKEDDNG